MASLQLRMYLLIGALFAIVYAVVVMIGSAMGVYDFYFYFFISLAMMFIQYMIGPKMIEWTMGLRYVSKQEEPQLHEMIETLARRAAIPVPRLAISSAAIPNAFAFGRSQRDGRVCITEGIRQLLNREELMAVLGHELTHIRNRDMLTISLLSVIPMIMYRLAWNFLFYGRRRDDRGATALIGLAAFLFYFITNLLVLYGSRVREYFADEGSVKLGNSPAALASALYKLVYGSARMERDELRQAEGMKAFFLNDPSRAWQEIREVRQLDLDKNGAIDTSELFRLRHKEIKLSTADRMLELLSTHPNMLKRIKHLSEYQAGSAAA